MPLQLNDIPLANGAVAPQTLDIESYFVRFIGEGDGVNATTNLTANFILKRAPTADGSVLATVSGGSVVLDDATMKGFPHYAELVSYLGSALYSAWLAQNPGYTVKQP